MNKDLLPSTQEVLEATTATFNLRQGEFPSAEQLKYAMTFLTPSLYALEHYRIGGGKQPVTFNVSDYNMGQAQAHRPWQVDILNDKHRNKVIMKSRQLGLSEVGIMEILWFADRYSEDGIKALYTFPTNRQMDSFIQTRMDPMLGQSGSYFDSILDQNYNSMKQKKIRDSFIMFRSSSKPESLEGIDANYVSLNLGAI